MGEPCAGVRRMLVRLCSRDAQAFVLSKFVFGTSFYAYQFIQLFFDGPRRSLNRICFSTDHERLLRRFEVLEVCFEFHLDTALSSSGSMVLAWRFAFFRVQRGAKTR